MQHYEHSMNNENEHDLRETVKYYFADFVRKGGGVPPKSVKVGGTPLTDKIRKVVFEVFPYLLRFSEKGESDPSFYVYKQDDQF